jgi:hypothetical protein
LRVLLDGLINVADEDTDLHDAVDFRFTHHESVRSHVNIDQFCRKS